MFIHKLHLNSTSHFNIDRPLGHNFHEFKNKQYFIGASKDKNTRLYILNNDGMIDLVDSKLINVKHLQKIDGQLFFSAIDENSNTREVYLMISDNEEVRKISELELIDNGKHHIRIKKLAANVYFEIENEPYTNLYYFDNQKMNIKIILNDIKKSVNHFGLEMAVLKDEIFLISRENENDRYTQIWKIK